MTIALDTPEQISMWVLLSRRAQLHLQLKGFKTPGLIKWCKENLPAEYGNPTTAAKAIIFLNDYIADLGGPDDPHMNYEVMERGWVNKRKHLVGWVSTGHVFGSIEAIAASGYCLGVQNGTYIFSHTLADVTVKD